MKFFYEFSIQYWKCVRSLHESKSIRVCAMTKMTLDSGQALKPRIQSVVATIALAEPLIVDRT